MKDEARKELDAIMRAELPAPPATIFVDNTGDTYRRRKFGTLTWAELKTKKPPTSREID